MRLVTWNCFRGDCLTRAADVADLAPDVLVLQECARTEGALPERVQWFGENPKHGMAIVAGSGYRLTPAPLAAAVRHSVFPAWLDDERSGERLLVLGVWAQRAPSYVEAILAGIAAYASLLHDGRAVILGDFNSHPRFDRPTGPRHETIVARLRDDFGLVSAYHALREPSGVEEPTHFWRWQGANGFHIDYCFVPVGWRARIVGADVIAEPPGSRQSDHRPLVIDVQSRDA